MNNFYKKLFRKIARGSIRLCLKPIQHTLFVEKGCVYTLLVFDYDGVIHTIVTGEYLYYSYKSNRYTDSRYEEEWFYMAGRGLSRLFNPIVFDERESGL